MTVSEAAERLSKISTQWSELAQAHSDTSMALTAQASLLSRYCGAIYYYLLAATRDPHAAQETSQEFALRFVRGDFHGADPSRGRFRDFIKTVLRNLVADHFRREKKQPIELPSEIAQNAPDPLQADAEFNSHWRQQLLDRTWDEMSKLNAQTGQPYHDVLRWKAENPEQTANDGASEFAVRLKRDVTPVGFRQMLHRARESFAELLLVEVARSLGSDDSDQIAQELADLELLVYCRPALERIDPTA